jgi:FkbM family methyltransferase
MKASHLIKKLWAYAAYPELKPIKLELHPRGEFISDRIRLTNRYYEFDMLRFMKKHFDCSRFVDIGANIGNHSNFFERNGSVGWAFEPSRRNFEKLEFNAPSFALYNVALSDTEGEEDLITFDSCLGNSYVQSSFDGKINDWGTGVKSEKILVATLDSFKINAPTLIKIDVEGSELKVLKGSIETLTNFNPVVALEIHSDETLARSGFPYTRSEIEGFLYSLGYRRILSYDETNHFFKKTAS